MYLLYWFLWFAALFLAEWAFWAVRNHLTKIRNR